MIRNVLLLALICVLAAFFSGIGHAQTPPVRTSPADSPYPDVKGAQWIKVEGASGRNFLTAILRQGNAEGVFGVTSPDHTARVLVDLLEGTGETAAGLLVERAEGRVPLDEVRRTFAAYDEAVERILGLPRGSFSCIDEQTLRAWFA